MAQITLNSTGVASNGALVLQSNGTTTAVTVSTGQVATFANDAVVNGLTVGRGAGAVSTNTAVGASAIAATASGIRNTAVGSSSLTALTSGAENTSVGFFGLTSNTTGANNTAFGSQALSGNTTGANNIAIGTQALVSNTTASNNTAVGYQAGYSNTTGTANAYFGTGAGYTATVANDNAYFGWTAGNLATGSSNTFIGDSAGKNMTTGQSNTILGRYNGNQGGLDIRTASNYIVLSDGDGNPRGIFSNTGVFYVGQTANAQSEAAAGLSGAQTGGGAPVVAITNTSSSGADASPPLSLYKAMTTTSSSARFMQFYANGASTPMGGIVGNGASNVQFIALSDAREKTNIQPISGSLNKIIALKPSSFNWIANNEYISAGFIAQEVKEVFPEYVVENASNEGEEQRYGLTGGMTGGIIPHLVKAIQELKTIVDAQAAEIAELKAR